MRDRIFGNPERGSPPSSEGGKVRKCEHIFLDILTLKADNYIHIFHVTTNSTPPSEEGGGPSLDDGGGRDVILKSIKTP